MKRARSKNKGHIDIMSNSSVEHQRNGSYSTNKPATVPSVFLLTRGLLHQMKSGNEERRLVLHALKGVRECNWRRWGNDEGCLTIRGTACSM